MCPQVGESCPPLGKKTQQAYCFWFLVPQEKDSGVDFTERTEKTEFGTPLAPY